MKSRATERRGPSKPTRRAAMLALLTALVPAGCGREFFREWANQDVSEAIFEKSRDPRWRIDTFSDAPPWMARYADPYDQDFPPAPPDDYATQALSPVPQWSYNRLIVPVEGTGYLTMLERFQTEHGELPPAPEGAVRPRIMPEFGRPPGSVAPPPEPGALTPFGALPDPLQTPRIPGDTGPAQIQDLNRPPTNPLPSAMPPQIGAPPAVPGGARPPGGSAPATPNSGTPPRPLSPTSSVPASPTSPPTPSPTTPGAAGAGGPQARSKPMPPKDNGVRLTALQAPAARPDQQPGPPVAPPVAPPASEDVRTDPLRTPRIPGDTGPREIQDLNAPVLPRPDLGPRGNAVAEAKGSEVSGLLGTGQIDLVESEAMGLPKDAKPYRVNLAQSVTLALINARVYQFQLEQLYLQALPVTLQRFSFAPQFIAGLSPITPTIGPSSSPTTVGSGLSPAVNPANSFSYRTRATGLQQSLLNMGTVAAVGKSFDNGAKVLAGFASQVVFNFTGVNPRQPGVQSYLPIQAFVPLLRGGGRAVTLEGLTQAERNLLYQIRFFAKFRQEFLITTIAGGSTPNFGTGLASPGFSVPNSGNTDPTTGFLNVLEDIMLVENNLRNVAAYEQFGKVYQELIKGEASGLTQLQVDQLDANLQSARSTLLSSRNTFRGDLDAFKMQIGLPPDTPMMIDRRLTRPFSKVFSDIETWARRPDRQLAELDAIAAQLPDLEDVLIDSRSCVNTFRSGSDDDLEDLLLAGERISLENRLDLMNFRAQVYDAWRQLRVTANALKGVLNITVTNQYLTPPTTNNPFAFLDQAKQFSLVLNAELPLIRINERNNFRTALINYQRQRRTLMSQEDFQKLQLRNDLRSLQVGYLSYQLAKRNFVLYARQKDQAFENIVAPPQGGGAAAGGATGAGNAGTNASAAVQTQNLTQAQNALINIENSLVTTWYGYQSSRMILYRDLGTLPYDEWEAFYELFPSEYRGLGAGGRGYASPIDAPTPSDIPRFDKPAASAPYGSAPARP